MQARGRCNLCGHDRFVTVAHRDRYGYPARAKGCLRCGLVFLDPALTPDAYAKFYRDVYRPLVSAYHGRRIDAETGYLCGPGRADPEARVPAADVAAQWRELRAVQNPLPAAPGAGAKP